MDAAFSARIDSNSALPNSFNRSFHEVDIHFGGVPKILGQTDFFVEVFQDLLLEFA